MHLPQMQYKHVSESAPKGTPGIVLSAEPIKRYSQGIFSKFQQSLHTSVVQFSSIKGEIIIRQLTNICSFIHLQGGHESLDCGSRQICLHRLDPRVQRVRQDEKHGHPGKVDM